MTALLTAVVLAVASAAAYAAASVLQERVAAARPPDAADGAPAALDFLVRPRWWLSVWLNGAGAALHVAALAFGSLSVVQPLGVLTLVLALPLGAATGGRRTSARQWRGAGATVLGLTGFLLLTAPGAAGGGLTPDRGAVVSVAAGATVLALALTARAARRPLTRCLLAATAAGVAFAAASALTQTVTGQIRTIGVAALLAPLTLVLVAMAVSGLLLSQVAYRNSGLGAPLAALTLANPVASTAIGVLALGDRTVGGVWGALAAASGAAVATAGVILLAEPHPTPGRPHRPRRPLPGRRPGQRRPVGAAASRSAAPTGPEPAGPEPAETIPPARRPASVRCPGRRLPAVARRRTPP